MQCRVRNQRIHGFSLVELSIVLVILGLLVGGVLSGQSLIRAAELRSVTGEYQRYAAAENSFRDKYFALPGDMANATAFWGYSGGSGCTNRSGTGTGSATMLCDGDGNGQITDRPNANEPSEAFQAWVHLAKAGLVEGSYTGVAGPLNSGTDYLIGVNAPASRIANVGWALTFIDNSLNTNPVTFNSNYLNWMTVGASDHILLDDPFLKPSEAWNIDTKMDDGMPGRGSVQTWAVCSTAATNTDRSAPYNLVAPAITCQLIFKSL